MTNASSNKKTNLRAAAVPISIALTFFLGFVFKKIIFG
jgi:hypothetical protein